MTKSTGISRRAFTLSSLGVGVGVALGLPSMARAQTPVTFAVPAPSALVWLPYWVAVGEGYMKDEGLDTTLEVVDGSASVLQALSSGQAQIGAPGPGPALGARARGVDVKYIYNLYPKSAFGLLVPEDSPITEPAQLKGKVIGVGSTDGAEVSFARGILSEAGMELDRDYSFLVVGDGGMAAVAFLRGEADAYAGGIADVATIARRGLNLREITPDSFLAFFGNGLAMLESEIEAHPEIARGFGRAIVRGMAFASKPENAEAVLAHCAAGSPQEGEDQEFAAALMKVVLDRMIPTEEMRPKGLGYQPPEHWQKVHDSSVESGALSEPLADLDEIYTNEFVEGWNS